MSLTKLALPGDLVLWQMLAVGISCRAWAATISAVAKRRGLVDKKSKMTNLEALLAFITREDPPPTIESLQMVVLELLAVPSIDDHGQVFLQHLFGNSGFFGYLNDVSSLAQIEDKARAVLGSTS